MSSAALLSEREEVDKAFEEAIADQVELKCGEIRRKCESTLAEMVKTKRSSLESGSSMQESDNQDSLQKSIPRIENAVSLCGKFSFYSDALEVCRDSKALMNSEMTNLRERMGVTGIRLRELITNKTKFPSDAVFHKAEIETKHFKENMKEMEEIRVLVANTQKRMQAEKAKADERRKLRDALKQEYGCIDETAID